MKEQLHFLPSNLAHPDYLSIAKKQDAFSGSTLYRSSDLWLTAGRVLDIFVPGDPRTRFQLSPVTDIRSYRTRNYAQYLSIYDRLQFIQEQRKKHVIYFH